MGEDSLGGAQSGNISQAVAPQPLHDRALQRWCGEVTLHKVTIPASLE